MKIEGNKAVLRQTKSVQGCQKMSRRDKIWQLKVVRVELMERLGEIERELLDLENE